MVRLEHPAALRGRWLPARTLWVSRGALDLALLQLEPPPAELVELLGMEVEPLGMEVEPLQPGGAAAGRETGLWQQDFGIPHQKGFAQFYHFKQPS